MEFYDIRKSTSSTINTSNIVIRDRSITSTKYFNVEYPNLFALGKNAIFIRPINLIVGSNIIISVIDSNQNELYSENNNFNYDGRILIPIYIYNTTTSNENITIRIFGKTNYNHFTDTPLNSSDINDNNIMWSIELPLNTNKINSSEIIFNDYPIISINDEFTTYNEVEYDSNARFITLSVSQLNNTTYKYPIRHNNKSSIDINYSNGYYASGSIGNNIQWNSYDSNRTQFKFDKLSSPNIKSYIGNVYRYNSNINYPIITINSPISISGSVDESYFISDMIGGQVYFECDNVNDIADIEFAYPANNIYIANIIDVIDSTHIKLDAPYQRQTISGVLYTYSNISISNGTIQYQQKKLLTNSNRFFNVASISIKNLNPLAGFIDSMKIYSKSQSDKSKYTLLTQLKIESSNLLIDDNSNYQDKSIGHFTSDTIIPDYWNSTGNILHDNNTLSDSVQLSNGYSTIETKNGISLYSNHPYLVKLNIRGTKSLEISNTLTIFYKASNGTRTDISTVSLTDKLPKIAYDDIVFNFEILYDDDIIFGIESNSGTWNISKIEVISYSEFGFTPHHINLKIPINPLWANDEIDLKFKFLNAHEEISKSAIELRNVKFSNYTPTYIGGQHNLLTGSLSVGNGFNSGVDISGDSGSMIRSIGYEGWSNAEHLGRSGFMLWSGSVEPNDVAYDYYTGVGIEIHDGGYNSMRFRTQFSQYTTGSVFEIRTDSFFLGQEGSEYISGSNGTLVISSSYFSLSEDGTVTINSSQNNSSWIDGLFSDADGNEITATPYDSTFRVKNITDTSKQIKFNAEYISTGQTREIIMANKTIDLRHPTFDDIQLTNPVNVYQLSHDSFQDYIQNEHIDWTNSTENLHTSGTISGGIIYTSELRSLTSTTNLALSDFTGNPFASFDYTDLSSTIYGNTTINRDLTIIGNLIISGSTVTANVESVLVEDNILTLNYGELGSGVTSGISGIEVDRGTLSKYQFVFDESSDTFRIGEINNLQSVATREDTPTNNYFAKWNSTTYQFQTVDLLSEIKLVDGNGSGIDSDLLDGQHGTYYSNYNNLSNKPNSIITDIDLAVTKMHTHTNKAFLDTIVSGTKVNGLNADLVDGYGFDQSLLTYMSPTFVTVLLTNLTNGYMPYHISDAVGLADSIISQNSFGIGIEKSASEKLDINGNIKVSGNMIRMVGITTSTRDGLTASSGDIIYNITTSKHQGFDGTSWINLY